MNSVDPTVLLLPLVVMGKLTHDEADKIRGIMKAEGRVIKNTRDTLSYIETILGRVLCV